MATRSKRFECSAFLKITAIILILVTLFTGGVNLTHWALKNFYYDSEKESSYTQTTAFYNASLKDLNTLSYYKEYYEDYSLDDVEYAKENFGELKSYLATLETSRKQSLSICSQLAVLYASEPPEDPEYYSSNDEITRSNNQTTAITTTTTTTTATTSATVPSSTQNTQESSLSAEGETDENGKAVTTVPTATQEESFSQAFASHDSWEKVVSSLEEKLRENCGADKNFTADNINRIYDNLVDSATTRHIASYNSSKQYAKNRAMTIGMSFALIDRDTGKIFSNCGLDDKTEAQAREALSTGDWTLAYSSENGLEGGAYPEVPVGIFRLYMNYSAYSVFESTINEMFRKGDNMVLLLCVGSSTVSNAEYTSSKYPSIKENFEKYKNDSDNYGTQAIILLCVAALFIIYLIAVTGKKSDGTFKLASADKFPVDLHFIGSFAAMFGLGMILVYLFAETYISNEISTPHLMHYMPFYAGGIVCVTGLVGIEWVLSVARCLRAGGGYAYKNTVYYKCFALVIRLVKWIARKLQRTHRHNVKLIKRTVRTVVFSNYQSLKRVAIIYALAYLGINLMLFGFFGLCLAFGNSFSSFIFFVFICGFNIPAALYIFSFLKTLDEIMNTADAMRNGDFSVEPDIEGAPTALRKFALDVISGRESIKNAVDEALKGERMKAELITNVSHDLKTPLTSIITYMDLLKKCEISDENALKYIAVLDDKSKRLKRLIEDLTEASKASTGNIKLNKMSVDLYELAIQAVGEHSDALEAMGLEAIIDDASARPVIYADSQRTWRVIDNLFSNAKKYAMPNTRVYINVTEEDGFGVFTMKNISRDALNIPPEELTQRFVRGDESRGSEGSGLGLSIATSLCELQDGTFKIEIDGDLFKATVRLPIYRGQAYFNTSSQSTYSTQTSPVQTDISVKAEPAAHESEPPENNPTPGEA